MKKRELKARVAELEREVALLRRSSVRERERAEEWRKSAEETYKNLVEWKKLAMKPSQFQPLTPADTAAVCEKWVEPDGWAAEKKALEREVANLRLDLKGKERELHLTELVQDTKGIPNRAKGCNQAEEVELLRVDHEKMMVRAGNLIGWDWDWWATGLGVNLSEKQRERKGELVKQVKMLVNGEREWLLGLASITSGPAFEALIRSPVHDYSKPIAVPVPEMLDPAFTKDRQCGQNVLTRLAAEAGNPTMTVTANKEEDAPLARVATHMLTLPDASYVQGLVAAHPAEMGEIAGFHSVIEKRAAIQKAATEAIQSTDSPVEMAAIFDTPAARIRELGEEQGSEVRFMMSGEIKAR